MRRWFKADLHVHTCLSPCGDLSMSPQKIVAEVLRQQIDIIAVTDHNSAENISAVMKAAAGTPIVVLPGMEVCTKEEAHVLAIFDKLTSALALQSLVYGHLQGTNNPDVFGLQVVANEHDEVERFEERLLIGAADLSVEDVVHTIHQLNGLAIAAHVDRESYSVIGQLGFIPRSVSFDALEISANTSDGEARLRFSDYMRYTFVRNSDAHFLNHIGNQTTRFMLEEPTVSEIARALRREDGRTVEVEPQAEM
jgi:hypothetical protein